MGMWADTPGLCRPSGVKCPIECDDSNRALHYSTVREASDPDVQNTPAGHRGHWVWHDMGDLGRRLVKITSHWCCWNEHGTRQSSRFTSQQQQWPDCTRMSRKGRLARVPLVLYYITIALVVALLLLYDCNHYGMKIYDKYSSSICKIWYKIYKIK